METSAVDRELDAWLSEKENDMVEDLTEVYANCTSPRIKAMYNSYGPQLLGAGTF